MKKLVIPLMLIMGANGVFANSKKTGSLQMTASEYFQKISNAAPYDGSWKKNFPEIPKLQVEKANKLMKEQEAKRKIASELDPEFYEQKMSAEFKEFRSAFLAVRTADDFENLLVKAEANYESYPADLQFIVAQLLPLRTLRGIVWRVTPTVSGSRVVHSLLLTQMKNIAVGINLFLPTEQWQAGFDYVTQPFVENGIAPFKNKGNVISAFPIGDESALQSYIRVAIIPSLILSASRLERLNLSNQFYAWDNKLLYGSGSFPSAIDRYALIGEVERHAALSNTYAILSELNYQSAYSMQGALAMTQEIGKLYGFDGMFTKVDGVPAKKRVAVIKHFNYDNWGLLFSDGKKYTNDAWVFLTKSIEHGDQMWQGMKDRPVSEIYAVENSYALPFQRPITNRFENLQRLTQGVTTVRSFITDETVKVNLREFYLNPPASMRSLYPIGFSNTPEMLSKKLQTSKGEVFVKYRNFTTGRATEWDLKLYRRYFPEVKTNSDLQAAVRILSQGWGTFAVAVPMMNYMN